MAKTIVGLMGSSVAKGSSSLSSAAQLDAFLEVCKGYEVKELDTARVYNEGKSEEMLGSAADKDVFAIATKAPAFDPGSLAFDRIIANCAKSLKALQVDKVDLYYLHGPDRDTPLETQCRAIAQLHKEGKFDRFGISNLSAEAVTEVCNICKQQGMVMPSVYQGWYNALHRDVEGKLFPILRSNNINFYAWGPLAGGALAKPIEELRSPKPGSRYESMPVFGTMFLKDRMVKSLEEMHAKCHTKGLTLHGASLRWLKFHSSLSEGDGLILGASSSQQLHASLKALQAGPLDDEMAQAFEDMWKDIKDIAPPYVPENE